jgi:hypothetical protein
MKMITLYVSEDQYAAYQEHAKRIGASTSELIRSAMDEYYGAHIAQSASVFDREPAAVGKGVHPLDSSDDLLDEMME